MATIRFGEGLELDPGAYELRREGRAVRLERIPMEILLLLIERRDQLVTREEIVEKIWGKGVFLDSDNSINVAIRKLRTALRDDSDDPKFIRTVTAKGYRFIAPVAVPDEIVSTPEPAPAPPPRRWLLAVAALVALVLAGTYFVTSRPPPAPNPATGRVMLAVLPFENLTGDATQDYFSDGLTEEMIARLGNLAPDRLGIIARTSVMHYKTTRPPLKDIAEDLGIHYVLEGSVRRDPGQLRIAVQLIRADDQTHVWSRQYDREPGDLLRVQADIAGAIAREIRLTFKESVPPAPLTPEEYEAYNLYLEGRQAWNERTLDGFRRAIVLFERAIAKRPDDAQAYAGLADAYTLIGTWGFEPAAAVIPKAKEAALAALRIDADFAAAHTSLALVHQTFDRDWPAAEARFRRAIQLDPNYVTARHWYAEHLGFTGRFDEALDEIERARQLDPLSLIVATDRGAILYFARRYDDAIAQFSSVLAVDPRLGRARLILPSYALAGRTDDALANIAAWRGLESGAWQEAWTAYVCGRAGKRAEAERAFRAIEPSLGSIPLDPAAIYATAHLGLGENDAAIRRLQEACALRSAALVALEVDPILDPIRSDPRFAELRRCAGFR